MASMGITFLGKKPRYLEALKCIPGVCLIGDRIDNFTGIERWVAGAPNDVQHVLCATSLDLRISRFALQTCFQDNVGKRACERLSYLQNRPSEA